MGVHKHGKGKKQMGNGHDLTYALRHGKLVSINEVGRGLQLDCKCPACGGTLVARKADVRIHHFAHRSGNKCETGAETALHLLAKKMVCTPGTTLSLPIYEIRSKVRLRTKSGHLKKAVPDVRAEVVHVTGGAQEVRFGDFMVDAVIDVISEADHRPRQLLVEIAVTHRTGKQKIRGIGRIGIPGVEIDLNQFPFHGGGLTQSNVSRELMDSGNVRWLYHPNEAEAREGLSAKVRQVRASDRGSDLLRKKSGLLGHQENSGIKPNYTGFGGFVERHQDSHGMVSAEQYKLLEEEFARKQRWGMGSRFWRGQKS